MAPAYIRFDRAAKEARNATNVEFFQANAEDLFFIESNSIDFINFGRHFIFFFFFFFHFLKNYTFNHFGSEQLMCYMKCLQTILKELSMRCTVCSNQVET